jgi:hypothetical protein
MNEPVGRLGVPSRAVVDEVLVEVGGALRVFELHVVDIDDAIFDVSLETRDAITVDEAV